MSTEERLALAIAKLREWAAECSNCGGTGIETFDDAHDDCLECLDIREVIAKCEAP
jgi:hypothetical protein